MCRVATDGGGNSNFRIVRKTCPKCGEHAVREARTGKKHFHGRKKKARPKREIPENPTASSAERHSRKSEKSNKRSESEKKRGVGVKKSNAPTDRTHKGEGGGKQAKELSKYPPAHISSKTPPTRSSQSAYQHLTSKHSNRRGRGRTLSPASKNTPSLLAKKGSQTKKGSQGTQEGSPKRPLTHPSETTKPKLMPTIYKPEETEETGKGEPRKPFDSRGYCTLHPDVRLASSAPLSASIINKDFIMSEITIKHNNTTSLRRAGGSSSARSRSRSCKHSTSSRKDPLSSRGPNGQKITCAR